MEKSVVAKLLDAARRFSAFDFAAFKICLLAFGVLLGAYFSEFFLAHIVYVWVLAIIAWTIVMIQVFRKYGK